MLRMNSHLTTHVQDGTGRTLWGSGGTDILTKWDEKRVDLNPISLREDTLKLVHRRFRRIRRNVTPAVRDSVDMNVDRDPAFAAGNSKRKVRTFRTYPCEGGQYAK